MCTVAKNALYLQKRKIDIHKKNWNNYNTTKEKKSFRNPHNNDRANTNKTCFLTPCKVFVQIFFYYKEIKCLCILQNSDAHQICKLRPTFSERTSMNTRTASIKKKKKKKSFLKIHQ